MIQDKFRSSEGKADINYYIYDCENPKAILQISHGMAEEGACYKELALFLNKHNYIVCVNDHLGHGDSQISSEALEEFNEPDAYKYVVADIKKLNDIVSKKYPELPYFMLGFSLGSFLFRRYLQMYPESLDGAIIMGTGDKKSAKVGAFKAMKKLYDAPQKRKFRFKILNKIREKREKRLKNNFIVLMADDRTKQKFANSWIRNYINLIAKFYNMVHLFKVITKRKNLQVMNKNIPYLLISGEQDSIGNYGKSVNNLYKTYALIGIQDLEIILYPGLKHVILMSHEKEQVMTDIKDWLDKHLIVS